MGSDFDAQGLANDFEPTALILFFCLIVVVVLALAPWPSRDLGPWEEEFSFWDFTVNLVFVSHADGLVGLLASGKKIDPNNAYIFCLNFGEERNLRV